MSTLSVTLPESILNRVESLAREDGVSVDAFVASVLSQRVAVVEADSYVGRRAARGSAGQLRELLAKAPDVEPEACDRIDAED